MAIAHIKKSQLGPSPKHGMGRAIFGIVMGVLGLIWGIVILWGIYS